MGATLTTFEAALKEHFEEPMQRQLHNELLAYQMMEKAKVKWAGKKWVYSLHTERNSGTDYTGGTLPTAGAQGYEALSGTAKKIYGRFSIPGDLLAQGSESASDSEIFADVMKEEMEGITNDVKVHANQRVFSGGRICGFIHQWKNEAGAADWEFSGDAAKVQEALTLKGGAVTIQVIRLDTYAVLATKTITAVDQTAMNISIGAALDTTGLPHSVPCAIKVSDADAGITAAFDNEPTGIYGNLAEPTHHNLDRTDATGVPIMQAVWTTGVITGAQNRVDLALTMFDRLYDDLGDNGDVDNDGMIIFMHHKQRQKYVAQHTSTLQNNKKPGEKQTVVSAGAPGSALWYGDIEIKLHRHCGKGLAIFYAKKTWKMAESSPIRFADDDGSILSRVSGQDEWEGFVRGYHQYLCTRPNVNGMVCGFNP